MVVIIAFMHAADLELYTVWGFRLDATPLQYISSPAEAAASIASAPVLLLSLIFIALSFSGIFLFKKGTERFPAEIQAPKIRAIASFFLAALLVLPLRGGWQQIPINQSSVYFSEIAYANHSGINVPWNVMYSLLKNDHETENPYQFLPAAEAESRVAALHPKLPPTGLLVTEFTKPNVLLIILESYTANYVGSITGYNGVTPNLDSIAREGLLFTNIYSSGDRSEKGMAAILSGFPAQPTTSVMKSPRKTEKLPYLSKEFAKSGYATSYYYGGELGFANLKSYLLNGSFHKFTDKSDFDPKDYNSKWGVHDHVLLDRVLTELNQEK
ncbi:MAG: sulfatase, partial [Chitinophagaceae bacterium]